jgi:Leucine-rich repeat (LRR) protein
MIVQIVLVIVIAVQVNSEELCPSVCYCYGKSATCRGLFSDVTNMTQKTFQSAFTSLHVIGRTRLDLEDDLFLRWKITSLTYLYLSRNNITKIWQRAFYSLADLEILYLSGNSITTLHSPAFFYNIGLLRLSLAQINISN